MLSPPRPERRECRATPPLPHAHRPADGHRIATYLARRPTYRPPLRPCPTRRLGLRTTEGVSLSDPHLKPTTQQCYTARDRASPVRLRTGWPSSATKILPSPIFPVRAVSMMASTTRSTCSSSPA